MYRFVPTCTTPASQQSELVMQARCKRGEHLLPRHRPLAITREWENKRAQDSSCGRRVKRCCCPASDASNLFVAPLLIPTALHLQLTSASRDQHDCNPAGTSSRSPQTVHPQHHPRRREAPVRFFVVFARPLHPFSSSRLHHGCSIDHIDDLPVL